MVNVDLPPNMVDTLDKDDVAKVVYRIFTDGLITAERREVTEVTQIPKFDRRFPIPDFPSNLWMESSDERIEMSHVSSLTVFRSILGRTSH